MSNRKLTSDKVLKAMTLNQKEDRVLAKTYGTLDLERKFSRNVLELHFRTVKSNYKHLKEKVSKIKSNLDPDEITALKQLEIEGRLKPTHTFNLNASMKIAAAARRLKLYPDNMKRSQSAAAGRRSQLENNKLLQQRSNTENNLRKRSNSVTGVFIDAPSPDTPYGERRNSIEGITLRPLSAAPNDTDEAQTRRNQAKSRLSASAGIDREKSKVSFKSNSPTRSPPATHAPFSSHEAAEKEASAAPTGKSPRDNKASFITEDSLENNLGADLFEERRQELIQEENLFYSNLEKRKDVFVGKVDQYLAANPPAKFNVPLKPIQIAHTAESESEENDEDIHYGHRRRPFRKLDYSKTFTSEEEYAAKGAELWKDMNKTRYLRLPDDKIDLSGVVTLAKDQMKLFKLLTTTQASHITSS